MKIIGVDESGDPGFVPRSSRYLIFAFVFCDSNKINYVREEMMKLLKKIQENRFWPKSIKELKFQISGGNLKEKGVPQEIIDRTIKNLETTRKIVLTKIESFKSIKYAVNVVDKRLVPTPLKKDTKNFYNRSLMRPLRDKFINSYNKLDSLIQIFKLF